MYILLRWFLNTLTLIAVTYIVPGISVESFWTALMAALFLGLVNAVIRPILLVLTLPINLLTLGLFTLVINALMFWFVSSFVKGFEITSFGAAFWGALAFLLIAWIINIFAEKGKVQNGQ